MNINTKYAQADREGAEERGIQTFADLAVGRKNNFDFLRFFLATLVIYHHSFDLLLGHKNAAGDFETSLPDTLAQLTFNQMDCGWLAVNGFFIISGFLIAASWLHSQGLLDYLKKRFLRIYPGYAAALLFCIFIVAPLSGAASRAYFTNPSTYSFLRPLFLRSMQFELPGVFTHVPVSGVVNGALWTIRYEIFCYLIIAGLGLATVLRKRSLVLALFIVWLAAYAAKAQGLPIPLIGKPDLLPRLLTYFLAGTVFYLYRDNIPYSRRHFAVCLAGVVAGVLLHATLWTLPIFGTYCLFFLAFNPGIRLQNFARYGDFSYGTYLYAFPIQQLLIQYLGKSLNPYSLFLFSWTLTVPVAALSWYLLEKPCLRLKSRPRPLPTDITSVAAVAVTKSSSASLQPIPDEAERSSRGA